MEIVNLVSRITDILITVLSLAFSYQVIYLIIGIFRRPEKLREAERKGRYCTLISARNEENVIAELIESLKNQNYPAELLDIYVVADNCTDGTTIAAEKAGATVYERFNKAQVGKGYALDYLLKKIREKKGSYEFYDGYLVFDADNIVDQNFVREINKIRMQGYDASTSYRNSKNFDGNWISASYSIAFLREATFVNGVRMILGTNCQVSGTGFMIGSNVIEKYEGWPFHLLTEDVEFSVSCCCDGFRIGYCHDAIIYDEQPTDFRQSWIQRLRWSKGFYQIMGRYSGRLLTEVGTGSLRHSLSCYDLFMTLSPASLLLMAVVLVTTIPMLMSLSAPKYVLMLLIHNMVSCIVDGLTGFYLMMFVYGMLTVIREWKRIPTDTLHKLIYLPVFPLFMMTYIPVTIAAMFRKVEWKAVSHHSVRDLSSKA